MAASSQAFGGSAARPNNYGVSSTVVPQIRPARMGDIALILALHREAFADKFGGAFGPDGAERGAAALAATWQRQGASALRGMFVAEYEGAVIGTTTVRTAEMLRDDANAAEIAFQEQLGLWRALRSLFALSLLDHNIERREGFVTDVAVLSPYRRSGVARNLLARAEQEALLRGKYFLGLYVSAANSAAIELYQRSGFYAVRTRRSILAWLFFGQGQWIYMRKDLV
ncbi:MAG: GNAT family N-acetyltransferase [Candidatus Viridilinea halotolerans]|uniref:GNAT family N-acetyltransferase n=1 Tax=Candidatus Viridilinea halotolerans TaxID=2491704 RepID=A0A426UB68_9CHLR|nr:MAG: GNAT family N-acetyltransferase [Candidatus Viridilinea halotolerans]